uniref:Innexin n=1 Tax=Meloidogyne incognita TaxID=6306 RepID=A0A914LSZ1_MELIC
MRVNPSLTPTAKRILLNGVTNSNLAFFIMRMVFSEVVGTLSFLQPQADDDMTDRLHYYYTTTFLLVTSVLISLKMYGGRPIECWMPAEYQNSWQEYTEIYCFSMNTYFTPFDKQIPDESEVREKNMISYYQWTPFFLENLKKLRESPYLSAHKNPQYRLF